MRPISVEFQAFGPYEKNQFVDFDKLSKDGLFLIDGKTGSGKTMILDAITYALYGRSTGAGRDDIHQLRCTHCDPKTDTFVKFIFEEKGTVYTFERGLYLGRTALNEKFHALRRNEDGVDEPIFENCKEKDMNKKAEELIGLSFDQFRQVIILPQGKFEQLLTSKSEDKEKILVNIFEAGKWQEIAKKYYEKADARLSELTEIDKKVKNSLKEEDCESIEDLDNLVKNLDSEIKAEEAAYKKSNYAKRMKELNDQKALAGEFKTLKGYKDSLKELKDEEKDIKAKAEALDLAEKADVLKAPFEKLSDAKGVFKERESEKEAAEKALKDAEKALKDAEKALEEHKKDEKEYKANSKKKTELELKKTTYESLDKLSETLKDAEDEKKALEKEVKKLQESADKATEDLNKAYDEYIKSQEDAKTIRESYMSGIKGHMAKELKDGDICPICGSTHHPKLAKLPKGSADSKDVEKAEQEEKAKNKLWKAADDERKETEKAANSKKEELAKANTEYEKAQKDVENAKKSLVSGIEDLKAYNKELKRLAEVIADYEDELKDISDALEAAKNDRASADKGLKSAEKEFEKAEKEQTSQEKSFKDALAKSPFNDEKSAEKAMLSDAEKNDLRNDIQGHKTKTESFEDLKKKLEAKLKGIKAPDAEAIDKELDEISEKEKAYINDHAGKVQEHERLGKKEKDLKKEYKVYEDNIKVAESNHTFAKNLRGDYGVGLQRYVLGIMFSSVIAAANEMLSKVSGGRYRLFRTSEKQDGSNKRGLDLKVYDSCGGTKDGRSVSTLSGGEKFLASLALSIGLASIAKNGGVDIQGIFIDEGFGTLDGDSINDAMEILDSVKKANGLVGIISHVEVLRENIQNVLCVEVDENKASNIKYV